MSFRSPTPLTGTALQVRLLRQAWKNGDFEYLGPEEAAERRDLFDSMKSDLISEWEAQTGQSWPRYRKPVFNSEGKLLRKIGAYYDAHEIIPNSYGGPQEWWNIHPASFPNQHQGGIHGAGALFRQLFPVG